jgi:ADP-ribosylglycohydrolase
MGLAVGDALGTTLEFKAPGTFKPVTDMVRGGPFGQKPGQWTDDTSMALCPAEKHHREARIRPEGSDRSLLSLVERGISQLHENLFRHRNHRQDSTRILSATRGIRLQVQRARLPPGTAP